MSDLENQPPPGGGLPSAQGVEWQNQLVSKIQQLELMCTTMREEIVNLKAENQKLRQGNNNEIFSIENDTQFETDEEELAKETEWIVKKRPSKKRKADSSPDLQETPNFTSITNNLHVNSTKLRDPRPPPIMVSSIDNYKKLDEMIRKIAKTEFSIKILNNGVYKINVANSDDYRAITKALNSENVPWYSYEDKHSRPIKVIVKNLHHSWTPEEIIADLQKQNFKAKSAIQKLKFKTKEPLDMFLISFDASENIKKIYEIKYILNTIVKVEPTKRNKLIPQCKKCQGFGHTKNYCGKPAKCVKCAGKHDTMACKTESSAHAKCANCGGNHPASYRGCIVAKELQKLRNQTVHSSEKEVKPPRQIPHNNIHVKPILKSSASTSSNKLYASVVKNDVSARATLSQSEHGNDNNNLLRKILAKLDQQEEFNKQLEKRLLKLEKATKSQRHD